MHVLVNAINTPLSLWWIVMATLIALLSPNWACLQLTEKGRPVLFCQSSIAYLPLKSSSIPEKLDKVRILGVSKSGQHDKHLRYSNLTGLETLTYLEISNFELEVIEADAFRGLRQLKVLDLSRNRITTLHPGAFSGLKLDLLSLTDNAGLNLVPGIFRGAEVTSLAVRNCGLRSLDYNAVAEAKPKQLRLSHNRISSLDVRFENLVKPWLASSRAKALDMDEWGFIDLTNNPLDCDCKVAWIAKVIEEQLFASKSFGSSLPGQEDKVKKIMPTKPMKESVAKRMYQLNLTCQNPPSLAGKPLPQSWNFHCPQPSVSAIVVNLLTKQADHAELTCVGQGQPAPRLAWTYRLNGHKVQKTLDIMNTEINQHLPRESRFPQALLTRDRSGFHPGPLSTTSISLNVSLREPESKNFTCTVWNDDSSDQSTTNYPFDLMDKLGGSREQSTHSLGMAQVYRIHEVTVSIHGPPKSRTTTTLQAQLDKGLRHEMNQTIDLQPVAVTENLLHAQISGPYDYLFSERFSLLQLLGAVFGTFIVTLALLYAVTHFLSCFCHFPHFPLKEVIQKRNSNKSGKKRRFSLITPREMALFTSNQCTPERTPLTDTSLTKTLNCDSAFSLLTSNTNNQISQGPSTVAVRNQQIPQALLLSGVPAPPGNRDSNTPPPNPAYWSTPEYTYTGTGSHEYDVPRPLESLVSSQSLARTDSQFPNQNITQSLLCMGNPPFLTGLNGSQFAQQNYNTSPFLFQGGVTLPPIGNQWPQQVNPELSALNNLFTWGQLGGQLTNGIPSMLERQLPSVSYAQYPSSNSAVYAPDYPAYLQTRPYPHHLSKMQTPLTQLMTQPDKKVSEEMGQENVRSTLASKHGSSESTQSKGEQNTESDSVLTDQSK